MVVPLQTEPRCVEENRSATSVLRWRRPSPWAWRRRSASRC